MKIGAITNTWQAQLATTSLPQLVERARRRGAEHVELRQGCLGTYEQGGGDNWSPDSSGLSRLVRMFPMTTFNLAVAYPCLSSEDHAPSSVFLRALDTTVEMAGSTGPHLRLVDPVRFEGPWEGPGDVPTEALGVKDLAQASAGRGARLSLENAGQPIRSMGILVDMVRESLPPDEGAWLGLCVDPINSLRADPGSDPIAEIEALPLDYLFMVHFKQMVGGTMHPTVDDGDLDYPRLVNMLREKGYRGNVVLEIPSAEEAFDNFVESIRYLEPLLPGE